MSAPAGEVFSHGPADGALGDRLWPLPAGAVVRLLPGTYAAPIALPHDIALVAAGGLGSVTLRAHRGPVVSLEGASRARLEGLVLQGPESGTGACLQVYMPADVEVLGCLLSGGRGRGEGGGAVDVQQGRVRLWRSRLTRSRAPQGGGVRAAGACRVELESCLLADLGADGVGGGGLFASRGGEIVARGVTFTRCRGSLGAVALAGGGQGGGGTITLDHALVGADLEAVARAIAAHQGGRLALSHCLLPKLPEPDAAASGAALTLGPGVEVRRVELEPQGEAPFSPRVPGLLLGRGAPWGSSAPASALAGGWPMAEAPTPLPAPDLYGRPRRSSWIGAVAG